MTVVLRCPDDAWRKIWKRIQRGGRWV